MVHFRLTGLLLIAVSVALPLVWFLPLAAARDPIAALSQYIGAMALILMGLSQLMATRWPGVETVFGGMDRVYVLHKWIGITVVGFILLHDSIDAEMRGLDGKGIANDLGETLGDFSYYGFLVLVGLSIATLVPYNLWRWTHRFMGLFYAVSALHFVLVAKPFALTDPPGIYVGAFCLLGLLAYAYTLLPARGRVRTCAYTVAGFETTGGALAVTVTPRRQKIVHRAGQFAFLRFGLPGLGEAHPFTISSAPRADGSLRFSIKSPGDWSSELPYRLAEGTAVRVEGPFGHFTRAPRADAEIWIAGGIGITPFLAWAEAMTPDSAPAHLFYSVRSREEAPHLDELTALSGRVPGLHLHLIETAVEGRLDAAGILARADLDISRTQVYFCGPVAMREALRVGLLHHGLRPGRFRFEEFEMRSGIGLGRLAIWLLAVIPRKLVGRTA